MQKNFQIELFSFESCLKDIIATIFWKIFILKLHPNKANWNRYTLSS